MSNRPSFRPIAAPIDVDDQVLDRINNELGVPTLRTPTPAGPSAGQGKAQDAPNDEPRPSSSSPPPPGKPRTHPGPKNRPW